MTEFADNIPLLSLLVLVPALGAAIAALAPKGADRAIRAVGLVVTAVNFLLALVLLFAFNRHDGAYQFVSQHEWLPQFGVSWKLGVDGISLFLVVLTPLIFLLALAWKNVSDKVKSYTAWTLLLQAGCIGAFLSLDIFLFFVFFEVILVPMYFLIAGWGLAERGKAAVKFFLYSFGASAIMLVGAITLASLVAKGTGNDITFDLAALANSDAITNTQAKWLFVAFAIAFAVKTPLFPVHTWLSITYSQAPITALIISSAVMVKLGTYGFIRFGIELFPEAAHDLAPVMLTLAVIGMIFGAIVASMHRDLRLVLAYSSLANLGFIVLGTFAFSDEGLSGAVLHMVSHGIIATALFLVAGFVYSRISTTDLGTFKGLQKRAPVLAALFTVSVMASIGVPGLSGFVGEFLILSGTFVTHRWWAVVGTGAVILAALYLLWAYQRGFHGEPDERTEAFTDIGTKERVLLAPLIVLMLFIGVYPQPMLDRIEPAVDRVLEATPGFVDGAQRVPVTPASTNVFLNESVHTGGGH